jgi:phage shock protein PspC (stress-responsive transcriptional regulator)
MDKWRVSTIGTAVAALYHKATASLEVMKMEDKRLTRRPDDGMIAGVAAGIADRFDIDVTLVRLAFVALAIVSAGTAIILYVLAAIIMPRADETPGMDSVRRGVDDLVARGKDFYGETRKVVDRATSRPDTTTADPTVDSPTETPTEEPATVSSTSGSNPTNS